MTPSTPSPAGCSCQPETPKSSRRQFLLWLGAGLNVVAAGLISIPIVGYLLSSFRKKEMQRWISLGPITNFPEGETRLATYRNPYTRPWDGVTADIPCWVRHISGDKFQVFAINCAHLGCPVRWFQQSKLFMCPCHGGVYYEDGSRASGPPPRGLYEYKFQLVNGEIQVNGGEMPTLSNSV